MSFLAALDLRAGEPYRVYRDRWGPPQVGSCFRFDRGGQRRGWAGWGGRLPAVGPWPTSRRCSGLWSGEKLASGPCGALRSNSLAEYEDEARFARDHKPSAPAAPPHARPSLPTRTFASGIGLSLRVLHGLCLISGSGVLRVLVLCSCSPTPFALRYRKVGLVYGSPRARRGGGR